LHRAEKCVRFEQIVVIDSDQGQSGASAAVLGPVVSVVGGGIVTVLVVTAVAFVWPELRNMRGLVEEIPRSSSAVEDT